MTGTVRLYRLVIESFGDGQVNKKVYPVFYDEKENIDGVKLKDSLMVVYMSGGGFKVVDMSNLIADVDKGVTLWE